MQAIILAGGKGTRLRPIVKDRPKAMVQIFGKPFLEYQLELLKKFGICDLIVCVGYLAWQIIDYFGNGERWEINIHYSVEESALLGTGGAIKNAESLIEGPFLAMNGDTYFDIDFYELFQFHKNRKSQVSDIFGTLALLQISDPTAYGSVRIDDESRIAAFAEKTTTPSPSNLVSAGVYILEPILLEYIPKGKKVSIERDVFPFIIEGSRNLLGYETEGFFVDVGTPAGYSCFQRYVKNELK